MTAKIASGNAWMAFTATRAVACSVTLLVAACVSGPAREVGFAVTPSLPTQGLAQAPRIRRGNRHEPLFSLRHRRMPTRVRSQTILRRRPRPTPPFKKMATTIKDRFDAVVRGMLDHRSNAFVESMNSQLQQAKREARGYRTAKNLITIAYLRVSRLKQHLAACERRAAQFPCRLLARPTLASPRAKRPSVPGSGTGGAMNPGRFRPGVGANVSPGDSATEIVDGSMPSK